MDIKITALGVEIESEKFIVLFGNKSADITALNSAYPKFKFKRIKQVHGSHIVSTSPHSIDFASEADAQFSSSIQLGLCIATADCAPIMLFCPTLKMIVGIHAGWRGIEKRIVPRSIEHLKRKGSDLAKVQVLVGPHIQFNSFEVNDDVKDLLLASAKNSRLRLNPVKPISETKSFVDLQAILKKQISEFQIPEKNQYHNGTNTVTNTDFHSYRRDKESSGRQLSFIAMK